MTVLTQVEISKILQIGQDFLFVDTCEYLDPGARSNTTYLFDERHTFMKHHFLSETVIPGVLIIESMLQSMALTIYSDKSWKGLALISGLNAQFLSSLPLNSKVEVSSQIRMNSGGRVEGEMTCTSNNNVISKVTCIFYSDYIAQAIRKRMSEDNHL